MADEKVNMSPEERKTPEAPAPSGPGDPPAPEHTEGPAVPGGDQAAPAHVGPATPEQSVIPGMGEDAPAPSGKVINLSDIQAADKGSKEASAPAPDKKAPEADKPPKRRGRPPKEQAGPTAEKKAKTAEPRTGRPSKVDKAAREEAPPSVRDKVSRGKKADKGKETGSGGAPASKSAQTVKPGKAAPVKEAAVPPPEIKLPPTPEVPPRPVEEGKIVYLKMSELHPFHTFREHPYKVQDDKAMDDLVGTIKEHGIMTPATVRPEKDGKGYEIIAGHRRHHGGERAGLEEMPCIVREMTDLEAVREMRNSNKQRGDPLPSELAKLLDLEVEAIKRQGARPKNEKEAGELRDTEAALSKTSELMGAVVQYAKTRPVFDSYKAARYSKKYLAQHEAELADYRAAKATMSDLLGGAKLPKMDALKKERRELSEKRKALYAEYRKAVAVKANIDHLLGHTDGRENKAQER